MKTILVATNFSFAALNACNYAADMALAINGRLVLLHVYQLPVSYGDVPLPMDEDEIMEDVQQDLSSLKNELDRRVKGKINITTEVRMAVFFPHELNTVCEAVKPYAVIMGSQGTTAAERFLFGGHTIYAMKNLNWPLITVSPKATYSQIKKIGFACDFNNVVGYHTPGRNKNTGA